MYEEVSRNKLKSNLLMICFFLLVGVIVFIFSHFMNLGYYGIILAFIIGLILTFITYYKSDSIVLRLNKARPVSKEEYPYLYNITEGLALASGLPMPRLYIIDDEGMNAFATGRDPKNSVICVTKGLVENLNRAELEGVIAHEMSHIKNYDIRLMMLTATMIGLVALLSDFFLRGMFYRRGGRNKKGSALILFFSVLLAILAPLIAKLIQLAISRRREFLADSTGALMTKNPEGLASALEKIAGRSALRIGNKATAHLFIANPLRGLRFDNLFSTHPPIEERIKRLRRTGRH